MKINKKRVGLFIALNLLLISGLFWFFTLKAQPTIHKHDPLTLEAFTVLNSDYFEKNHSIKSTHIYWDLDHDTIKEPRTIDNLSAIDTLISSPQSVRLYFVDGKTISTRLVNLEDTTPPVLKLSYNDAVLAQSDTITINHGESLVNKLKAQAYDIQAHNQIALDITWSQDLAQAFTEDVTLVASTTDKTLTSTQSVRVSVKPKPVVDETPKVATSEKPSTSSTSKQPATNNTYDAYHKISVLVNKQNPLPLDFVPKLTKISSKYAVSDGYRAHPDTTRALIEMIDTMEREVGLWMRVTSSYRDAEFQGRLYRNAINTMGFEKAQYLSAKPGTSEHQTGLAIDMVANGYSMYDFGKSEQSKWVNKNAHRFGFIVRYKEGKTAITGYSAEPWHLRYFGSELAGKLYASGLTYEEYLNR